MDSTSENLSNQQLINGLLHADDGILRSIYLSMRPQAVRAVTSAGGSDASGKFFFHSALIEAAGLARDGKLNAEEPLQNQVRALALAHYLDWLVEKNQPLPETDQAEGAFVIPDSEALRNTRKKIDSWKNGELKDDPLFPLWDKLRSAERWAGGDTTPENTSHLARNLLILFVFLTVGYVVYRIYNRTQTPAEVYGNNFTPPESLMSDLAVRYGPEMGNDSVSTRPGACESYMREADEFYKKKDFESAQASLYHILEDSLAVCQSDALFYIGVIALERDKPGLALECFSKIEDIEHFGDDIYWYQALAMVKLADMNPLLEDKARGAVERARSNTQDSLRRAQAERMLKHLSE